MINEGYIKQSPFAGFGGFGGGATTILLGGGGAEKYWIAVVGNSDADELSSRGVDVDSKGNVYVTGGELTVDNGRAYSMKYSPDGELEWTRRIGTTQSYREDFGRACAVDSSDGVYFVLQTESPGTTGSYDIGLVKFNSDGDEQWQRYLGGSSVDRYAVMSIDSSDRVFVGTQFRNSTDYGPLVALYDTSGTLQWKRQISGGTYSKNIRDMSTDPNGNVYISWSVYTEYHMAKWNSSGTYQWYAIRTAAGANYLEGMGTDSNGNTYLVGTEGYGNYGGIMKYDTSGTWQWAKEVYVAGASSIAKIRFYSADVDEDDNVYITGEVGNTSPSIVIIKIDSDGNKIWGRKISGSGNERAYRIKVKGEVMYITGETSTSGPGTINYFTIKLPTDGSLLGTYGDYTYETWIEEGYYLYQDWSPTPYAITKAYVEEDATGATDKAGTLIISSTSSTSTTTPVEE